MTDGVTDRAIDVVAHLRALYDDVWDALAGIPGVRGLGIGLVGDGSDKNREIGWRVYVDPDRDRPIVPEVIAACRTCVLPASSSALCYGEDVEPTLKPGITIGIRGSDPGTLGCFARLKSDPTKIVLLSNSHVLYSDSAQLHGPGDGNAVGQPSVSCCWCCKCRVIARNLKNSFHPVTIKVTVPDSPPETGAEIDAAIALLNSKRPFTNDSGFYGMITGTPASGLGISGDDPVEMVGSTSGHSTGRVLEFKTTAHFRGGATVPPVLYPFVNSASDVETSFAGAQDSIADILIVPDPDPKKPNEKTAFARKGDSGAVIVNAARQVVGILHAAIPITPKSLEILNRNATKPIPPHVAALGSACRIGPVLDLLDIEIVNNMSGTAPSAGDDVPLSEEALQRERAEELAMEQALRDLTREVKSRALGREIMAAVERHRPEAGRLMDRKREVTVAWHRMEGPAYAAHVLNSFRNHDYTIPGDVHGVTPRQLITRMAAVLRKHGSDALRAGIDRYEVMAFDWAADVTSVWTLVERLRRIEIDEPPAIDREVTHAG